MDITCGRCNASCEDSDHVFRGCQDSINIWEDVCEGVTRNGGFNLNWKDWLHQNLKCNKPAVNNWPNYLLFVVVLWFIWK